MRPRTSLVLSGLLPDSVHAYEADLGPGDQEGSSARQREFAAGRACARAGLQQLGIDGRESTVGRRRDRSPSWPVGAVGSIAHCPHLAVAVVGGDREFASLGVDVEDEAAVHAELAPVVLTPPERTGEEAERSDLLAAVFSMKEAAYKCWYPLTQIELDFADIRVRVEPVSGDFRAEMVTAARRRPLHLPVHGAVRHHGGHVYAAAWIARSGPSQRATG